MTYHLGCPAQALVDAKMFDAALEDFSRALTLTAETAPIDQARIVAGRALAHEGLSNWQSALNGG